MPNDRYDEVDSKRIIWSTKETIALLDVCLAKNMGKLMVAKQYKRRELYYEIAKEMNRVGHAKSAEQVMFKLKNLFQTYRKGLPEVEDGQSHANRKHYTMWGRMHELFKYRQINLPPPVKREHENIMNCEYYDSSSESVTPAKVAKLKEETNSSVLAEGIDHDQTDDPLGCELMAGNSINNSSRAELHDSYNNEDDLDDNLPEAETGDAATIPTTSKEEVQEESGEPSFMKKTKSEKNTSNYFRCVKFMVDQFKNAQEDLQNKFYTQQLRLQQQQQEWEEKILDEEREFFAKILKSTGGKRRNGGNLQSEDDFDI